MKIKGGDKGFSHQAVWADADRFAPVAVCWIPCCLAVPVGNCVFICHAICRYLEERLAEQELDAHERELEKQKAAGQESLAAAETEAGASAEPIAA